MATKEEDEKENYIGRTVQKYFAGFGVFSGKVLSFNKARNFYKVKYDDGDREELELKELKEILVGNDDLRAPAEKPKVRRGRKRKSSGQVENRPEAGNPSGMDVRLLVKNVGDGYVAEGKVGEGHPSEESKVRNVEVEEMPISSENINEVREERGEQEDDELLQPIASVSLANTFERTAFDSELQTENLGFTIGPAVCAADLASCDSKRIRLTPTSESFPTERYPFQALKSGRSDDIPTAERKDEADLDVPVVTFSPGVNGLHLVNADLDGGFQSEPNKCVAIDIDGRAEYGSSVLSLPPSSTSLGAIDHCVADLFQVYSMLRSFSHVIFLSPFSLEEFVWALSSKDVSSIVDSAHLCLLQTLRRQLERLSKNGSKSATFTLRLSDWSLLDNITWPSFLMAYLLTQGFPFEHGHTWVKAGLSVVEYCKLLIGTKLSILSFLCDKVLDTEEVKAELARRALFENDPEVIDTKGSVQKKNLEKNWKDSTICEGEFVDELSGDFRTQLSKDSASLNVAVQGLAAPSTADSIRVGRHLDEDGNLDECVLCAMDGNLICCDGCPAAYHSRCVGVTRQGLPPGDWFCPECRADKMDPRGAGISKGVHGGELLPVGPDGQLFFATCGYLLISQRGVDHQVIHRYYSPQDLPEVVKVLQEAGPMFATLRVAVQLLCQPVTNSMILPATYQNVSSAQDPSCLLSSLKDENNQSEALSDSFGLRGELPSSNLILEQTKLDLNVPYIASTVMDTDNVTNSHFPNENYKREMDSSVCDQMIGLEADGCGSGTLVGEHEKAQVCLNGDQDCVKLANVIKFHDARALSVSGEFDKVWRQNSTHDSDHQTLVSTEQQNLEQVSAKPGKEHETEPVLSTSTPYPPAVHLTFQNETISQDMEDRTIRLKGISHTNNDEGHVKASSSSVAKESSVHPHTELVDEHSCPQKSVVTDKDCRIRNLEREQYSSTMTQITACAYTNKYSNCDFVATASFNLAVIAGCVDELVEDRNGNPRKSKPTSVSDQTKAFTQASGHFFWPSSKKRSMDIPKEKCGWCINCRSIGRRGCLLTQVAGQMAGGAAIVAGGIRPIKGGYGHYPAVAAYILYMEENLHGLLGGPWEIPGHRKSWRRRVEQAKSICDVKDSLLDLELNLRNIALSADWEKFEEDAPESIANSVVIVSGNGSFLSKKFTPKKRGRPAVIPKTPAVGAYDGACFGVFWWRGASISRQVYNWESLPRSAVKRAGRRGGFKEIAELVYMKNLDLPRRTRRVAWRTRLEKISSVAQLAVEVRHLDTFIKWNDIISPLEASTTHNIKGQAEIDPAFRNAEIRGKSDESGTLMYLLVRLPAEADETMSSPRQKLDAGPGLMEISSHKKQEEESKGKVWVAETKIPLFMLKEFEEKMRTINHSKLPKSLKKAKVRSSEKKTSFWKVLCSSRPGGVLDSKKLSVWLCEHCKLSYSESQSVECQRCSGKFHLNCTEVEDSINGIEKVSVCKSCIKIRLGQRMRKPSYKMLAMQSQSLDGAVLGYSTGVAAPDNVERASKSDANRRHSKDSLAQRELSGRKRNRTESESDTTQLLKRPHKKKKIHWPSSSEEKDITEPRKRGRKKKAMPLDPPQDAPTVETRKSVRVRSSISPIAVVSKPEQQILLRANRKLTIKLSKKSLQGSPGCELQNETSPVSARRTSERQKQRPQVVVDDHPASDAEKRSPVKRKRLKIIFANLRQAPPDASVQEVAPKRKSGNGLNFGCRIVRSEADIERFRQDKLILPDLVGLRPGNGPTCGLCRGGYEPGQLYVGCEYCAGWYHGDAVGLKTEDAPFLIGYKCHKCRKCRAPSCSVKPDTGVKTRKRRTIDHGEVIDAENMNRSARLGFPASSVQPSWQMSPGQDYCEFSDGKAFPDFVAATNQAEAALAVDSSSFEHVLAENFVASDLVLPGDPQLQLPPMSLEDQQVNMWTDVDSGQLGLHVFPSSHAHQSAPSISFSELLASEDDYFEGVPGTGLGVSTDWAGEMYPSHNLTRPQRPSSVAETEFRCLDESLPSKLKESKLNGREIEFVLGSCKKTEVTYQDCNSLHDNAETEVTGLNKELLPYSSKETPFPDLNKESQPGHAYGIGFSTLDAESVPAKFKEAVFRGLGKESLPANATETGSVILYKDSILGNVNVPDCQCHQKGSSKLDAAGTQCWTSLPTRNGIPGICGEEHGDFIGSKTVGDESMEVESKDFVAAG